MSKFLPDYRSPSKESNVPPPVDLLKSPGGEYAVPPKSTLVSSDMVSYSTWAGVSRVQTQSLDKFGNAKGNEFDLVRDGTFDNEKIYVLNYHASGSASTLVAPKKSLERKGLQLVEVAHASDAKTLKSILKDTSQFWLISSGRHPLENAVISVIQDYFEEGHGQFMGR